jgi:hypothetical protein
MPAGSLWIADARLLETAVAVQSRQAGSLLFAALQNGHRALVHQRAARFAGCSPPAGRRATGTGGRCGSHQTNQRGATARLGGFLTR